jgi:hypothetical protein
MTRPARAICEMIGKWASIGALNARQGETDVTF